MKSILFSIPLLLALGLTPIAYAQSDSWNLTVFPINVPFGGQPQIELESFRYHQQQPHHITRQREEQKKEEELIP